MCFSIILFCTIQRKRQKTKSNSSKSLSSRNKSCLTIYTYLFQNTFCRMQICWTLMWDSWKGRFGTIPVTTVNSTLAVHAITLLALCYLPGCIGAWIQIFRGTKYSRFPNWLDKWLKMRKQLGLLMLFSPSLHVRIFLPQYMLGKLVENKSFNDIILVLPPVI